MTAVAIDTKATDPTATAPQPFTNRLLSVLQLFDRCRGAVAITSRTIHGIGRTEFAFVPPIRGVPFPILDAIRDREGLRFAPSTQDGGRGQDLPAAFVLWRLKEDASARRYVVVAEEQQRVREALAGFALPPAFFIDCQHEVVALWPLTAPLAVDKDPERASALLARLAERLSGDVEVTKDPTATLPIAGAIRSWNSNPPDFVDVIEVQPEARYTVEALEEALGPKGDSR